METIIDNCKHFATNLTEAIVLLSKGAPSVEIFPPRPANEFMFAADLLQVVETGEIFVICGRYETIPNVTGVCRGFVVDNETRRKIAEKAVVCEPIPLLVELRSAVEELLNERIDTGDIVFMIDADRWVVVRLSSSSRFGPTPNRVSCIPRLQPLLARWVREYPNAERIVFGFTAGWVAVMAGISERLAETRSGVFNFYSSVDEVASTRL